ncbi:MAG: 2Fe-2S iron-sulfur cluster binding domain-containing protein [Aphanocapsa feldmannii 277cV]|uniref:2Fe-2S iron-sulfur cluster binding domain-containing protein n=1 Tax=Aphanocapsa feldmannii 277cV TaxID=2507553 RepID=A0A524RQS7_9CHRO|nr:MAG: 2Fe-2S iron-sulfur cluster binding domain-containing protein [Aphanocapsa feldmannii 288cV]TGG96172.1 MAG: 2Fe-2S iron-sulfur cluster binding domain-containing protein [Aphanocapsa feldmannii 277cV]
MPQQYRVVVHDRQAGSTVALMVPRGAYILQSFEQQGQPLPFSCRNGCCTTCAVRVLSGTLDQREALGLSPELRERGYGLLCIGRASADLEVETQDEDEVYMLQFGRHFGQGRTRRDILLEED